MNVGVSVNDCDDVFVKNTTALELDVQLAVIWYDPIVPPATCWNTTMSVLDVMAEFVHTAELVVLEPANAPVANVIWPVTVLHVKAVVLPVISYYFDQSLTERQREVLSAISVIAFFKFLLVFVLS